MSERRLPAFESAYTQVQISEIISELEGIKPFPDFYEVEQKAEIAQGILKVRELALLGTDNLDEREQALIAGPGQVNSVAPQLTYREIREKYSGFNNYQAYFSGETSYIGQIYRQQAVFQRFSIIYPELTTYLFELEAEYYDLSSREQHLDSFARPNTIQEIISSSYDYMREQLDIDDMYVRDAINKGDDQYLTS